MPDFDVPDAAAAHPHSTELVIRRSRFLAQSAHTPHAQAARSFVESIRSLWPDATHHCWAYVAGAPGDTAHIGSSDDGEPHGTAGRPMLHVVLHSPVGEVCIVVSRWFGGVKLGTGGLVRAYQESVRQNMATLPLRRRVQETCLRLALAYAHVDVLHRLLPTYGARIAAEEYTDKVYVQLFLPETHKDAFIAALAAYSNGSATCQWVRCYSGCVKNSFCCKEQLGISPS